MKSKKTQRLKIAIGILAIIMIYLIIPNKTQGALQANGDEPKTYNVDQWITEIRQMQASGGTLGLTDTINDTNLTSTNKNLDIHMEKNTEYGAMIILSASSYGNPDKVMDGGTTTGNTTGVVMKINNEWVAAGTEDTVANSLKNASERYKNTYTADYVEKTGDAIATVGSWHESGSKVWIRCGLIRSCNGKDMSKYSGLLRSYAGSIYSYFGEGYYSGNSNWPCKINFESTSPAKVNKYNDAYYTKPWSSRAVVVVGSGV